MEYKVRFLFRSMVFIFVFFIAYAAGELDYAAASEDAWQISVIDSIDDIGEDTSIAIDSNNNVHISYYDVTSGALKYANNVSGFWVTEINELPRSKLRGIENSEARIQETE